MKVILVGAGPGDPGLLTLKGRDALARADVIIYDALVNPSFLDCAKQNAELIYVGKVASDHALPQNEINDLLARKAEENGGQLVARLKGGDPYIFGRGGEEAEFLQTRGIPFEEIPGVTSAIAAPSYAGMPLTHRGYASSLTIITGHEDPAKARSSHNWQALATSGSTLVFVMGMKNLAKIAAALIEHGMNRDTPAAIIYRGTTPLQRTLVSTLAELPAKAIKENFSNPSVIVVGKVALLHNKLAWFEKKPLLGKRIIVTRAREQASGMAGALEELGADVIQCPSIAIKPLADYSMLDEAIEHLADYEWIIFTSANGVKYFWQRLERRGLDTRALAIAKIAAIGPATGNALREKGIVPDLVPSGYVAEKIAEELITLEDGNLAFRRVLIARAAKARMELPDMLAQAGAIVDVAPAYETVRAEYPLGNVGDMIQKGEVDCVTFASSSTVENFLAALPPSIKLNGDRPVLASIGPITTATLRAHGLDPAIQAPEFTIPALVKSIVRYFENKKS